MEEGHGTIDLLADTVIADELLGVVESVRHELRTFARLGGSLFCGGACSNDFDVHERLRAAAKMTSCESYGDSEAESVLNATDYAACSLQQCCPYRPGSRGAKAEATKYRVMLV